jgi:predicted DNA-binding transcriptional regulator YafY
MSRARTKTERLLAIEALLLAYPNGLRQCEIAERLGVHRSTVFRDLPDLTTEFQVYEAGDGRLAIDRRRYLARLRITVHEAAAIYLAARLLHRQSDEHNPHAVSALTKLGAAIGPVAPQMARGIIQTADCMRTTPARDSGGFLRHLETLTQAWVEGRWLDVAYKRRGAKAASQSRLAPYLLEAGGPGLATYVVGLREPPGEIRVLKVERIVSASLTNDHYSLPADLDLARVFAGAWGVWLPPGGEAVEVVLRFAPSLAPRVREARWHASERTEEGADGALVWRANVGDTTEILPWVLGWGSGVEVIAPAALRAAVAEEHRAAAAVYD